MKGAPAPSLDPGAEGFFLLRPDGTILPAAELAALASGRAPAPGPRAYFKDALRLSPEQAEQFAKWLELVCRRHRDMPWDKLAPLAPVQEAWTGKAEEDGPVRLAYRKLADAEGNLAALAVFLADTPPSRLVARRMEAERQRHQLEIRDVLALAANPPET